MANLDLSKYGITDVKEILHNKRLKKASKAMKKVR